MLAQWYLHVCVGKRLKRRPCRWNQPNRQMTPTTIISARLIAGRLSHNSFRLLQNRSDGGPPRKCNWHQGKPTPGGKGKATHGKTTVCQQHAWSSRATTATRTMAPNMSRVLSERPAQHKLPATPCTCVSKRRFVCEKQWGKSKHDQTCNICNCDEGPVVLSKGVHDLILKSVQLFPPESRAITWTEMRSSSPSPGRSALNSRVHDGACICRQGNHTEIQVPFSFWWCRIHLGVASSECVGGCTAARSRERAASSKGKWAKTSPLYDATWSTLESLPSWSCSTENAGCGTRGQVGKWKCKNGGGDCAEHRGTLKMVFQLHTGSAKRTQSTPLSINEQTNNSNCCPFEFSELNWKQCTLFKKEQLKRYSRSF